METTTRGGLRAGKEMVLMQFIELDRQQGAAVGYGEFVKKLVSTPWLSRAREALEQFSIKENAEAIDLHDTPRGKGIPLRGHRNPQRIEDEPPQSKH